MALTAGTDTLTGTANDDVFNAQLSAVQDGAGLTEGQTLNNGDILDGGEGTDRLNVVLNGTDGAGAAQATTDPEAIDNIEQFFIQSRSAAGNTLDMQNVSGVEQLWNDRSTRDLTVTNLSDEVVLGLNEVRQGTDYNVTATYDITSQDVVLQGAGRAPTAAGNDAATLTLNSSTGGSITALNLVAASGLNNVALAGDLNNVALADLSVTGAGDLILNAAAAFAGLESVSAGDATGNLVLDISGSAVNDLAVVTGSGDDTVTIDGTLIGSGIVALSDDLVLNLGEGSNTLGLTGMADQTELNALDFTTGDISGVSALEISNDGAAGITLAANATVDMTGTTTTDMTFAEDDAVALATFDLAFDNTQDSMNLTFEDTVDNGTVDFGDAVETATVNSEAIVGGGAVAFTGEALQSLTINAEADFTGGVAGADFNADGDLSSLTTLTLNDESEDGDSSFVVELDQVADLATIDLSGVTATYDEVADAFVGGDVTLNADGANGAAFGGAVSINVGSAALTYTADTTSGEPSVRETFVFTADDINDISVTNFEAGAGANRDRLDFTQFEGISGTEDLNIVDKGGNAEITAADGQFNGTITLVGVAADAALNESLDFA